MALQLIRFLAVILTALALVPSGVYARYLLPRLTDLTMSRKLLLPYRQRVIGDAAGRVLEIGIGSGLNLPLYSDAVEEVIGVDVSLKLLAMAERAAQRSGLRVRLLEGSAELLPSTTADKSVDTVVVTWALCSIPDARAALVEAHRVLRTNGSLRFVEHSRSPDTSVAWWQDHLTPLWRGTVFPKVMVEARRYRLRMLNACNARFLNLQLYVADASPNGITLNPATGVPTNSPAACDPNNPGGSAFVLQIGTEGGFLPKPANIPTSLPFNPVQTGAWQTRRDIGPQQLDQTAERIKGFVERELTDGHASGRHARPKRHQRRIKAGTQIGACIDFQCRVCARLCNDIEAHEHPRVWAKTRGGEPSTGSLAFVTECNRLCQ